MNLMLFLLISSLRPSSVCHELNLAEPIGEGDTVKVTATICEYHYERFDGDYHLYLSDSGCGMIAEIKPNTLASKQFAALRTKWNSPRTVQGKYWRPVIVTITGKRHYDHEHFGMPNRCGLRPDDNGYHIEINPVAFIK